VRKEKRRGQGGTYIFDFRLDLHVRVDAEDKVLDRPRMLASPGVDLRREDVSSVTHVSSLGFFSAEGVP
jgi:hypothetical protein